jgi:hypothetical protein
VWHTLRCSLWGEGAVGSAVSQGSSCFDLLPVSSIAERPSPYAFCGGCGGAQAAGRHAGRQDE